MYKTDSNTDLLIQEYIETDFDVRVIVLDGQPSSYARWVLEAANARVITVDDNSIAA